MKQLAHNKEGKPVKIENAIHTSKGGEYYDLEGRRLDAVLGEKLSKHFRCVNTDFEYCNETALHSDAIMYWCDLNYFEVGNLILKPYKTEYNKLKKPYGGFIPDAVMFDEDNNVLAWLEIEVTHANEPEKLKYIKENNIICINIKYGRESNYNEPWRVEILQREIAEKYRESNRTNEETRIIRDRIQIAKSRRDQIESNVLQFNRMLEAERNRLKTKQC